MLRLAAGDFALTLAPERGGSVLALDWRGKPLMRPVCGPDLLDAPPYPLAPFSLCLDDRVPAAKRCNTWLGTDPAPLLDWLGEWSVAARTDRSATLIASCSGTVPFVASQAFTLDECGLSATVRYVNLAENAVPVTLALRSISAGGPREAVPCKRPLEMRWPEYALGLVLEPSDNLAITGLTAPGADIRCCAQPVMLAPGGVASAGLRLRTIDAAFVVNSGN